MVAIISIKRQQMSTASLRGRRDMCASPSPHTNAKALKIKIYNDDAEMTLAMSGLVIIRLPSLG
jgi:hypothetical protein